MSVEVRRLDRAALWDAPALLVPEGWGFTLDELERLHRLGGAVGAYQDGALAGFLTYVDHPPVRWVGNVVVSPKLRGQGIAARMMDEAMRGASTTGLYAVEKAVPLYERAGFVSVGEAWAHRATDARPRAPAIAQAMERADLIEAARLDRAATRMDRGLLLRELLQAYPDGARVVRANGRLAGFGFAKASPDMTEIGPVVARDRPAAERLLDALLATTSGPHEAAALGANAHARGALAARGFVPTFRTLVMFRGQAPGWSPPQIVVAAGLEKG